MAATHLNVPVGAVVLAAGESRRMGQSKMVLPWGQTTVIGHIVQVLLASGISEIRVVTGSGRDKVEKALLHLPIQTVYNPDYANDDMALSLRTGLSAFGEGIQAALVVLGDQPQIETGTVNTLLETYLTTPRPLIVPSYHHRRGHPWLVARGLWEELIAIKLPTTLRDFLNTHAGQIHYVNLNTPGILKDMDTPDDYARERPPEFT